MIISLSLLIISIKSIVLVFESKKILPIFTSDNLESEEKLKAFLEEAAPRQQNTIDLSRILNSDLDVEIKRKIEEYVIRNNQNNISLYEDFIEMSLEELWSYNYKVNDLAANMLFNIESEQKKCDKKIKELYRNYNKALLKNSRTFKKQIDSFLKDKDKKPSNINRFIRILEWFDH
ncbi:uncharacterized protein VNE69_04042 [Vairimorpha necatrix]|uniref:Uncharacterized protein n=1 Tax=Vairimorpha necatrix TaxID=6039 RepID=A0AAX4JB74_9MICR